MISEAKMREALELAVVTLNRLTGMTWRDDLIYETLNTISEALAQPEPVELTDEEILIVKHDYYSCQKNEWHDHDYISFTRAVIDADRAKRGGV